MDGSKELYDGTDTLNEKYKEFADGISSLQSGVNELSDGAKTLDDGATEFSATEGAQKVDSGSKNLKYRSEIPERWDSSQIL